MKKLWRSLLLASFALGCATASPRDLMSDTWVATDGLGRTMPEPPADTSRECKPRTVGISISPGMKSTCLLLLPVTGM